MVAVVLGTLAWSAPAVAQETPEKTEAAPDIVRLRDGGMLRGTISELEAGSHVIIVTIAGSTRRLEVAEVSYAGPLEAAPKPASDASAPGSGSVSELAHLELVSPDDDVTFYKLGGMLRGRVSDGLGSERLSARQFDKLCDAPCEVDLAIGEHRFGLSQGDASSASSVGPVSITGDGTLTGHYESHAGTRAAGLIMALVGGAVAGTVMGVGSRSDSEPHPAALAAVVTFGMTAVVGVLMAMTEDEAHVELSR